MKWQRSILFLFLLLLISCSSNNEVPTATVAATEPATEVAAIEPTASHTAVPQPTFTATAVPSTNTPAPEPATITPIPTTDRTGEVKSTETAVATEEATASSTATTAATSASTATAVAPSNTVTATVASTTPATAVAPPPAGNVPAPNDNNYPGNTDRAGWESRINVPAGFTASYYGRIDGSPTSITFGPDGSLYIASMTGTIYKMDASGNASPYVSGFLVPTGLAFQPGTDKLFVSSRVLNQDVGGESKVSYIQNGGVTDLIRGLPCCYTSYHAANGIAFGPDGMGYVGVGGRADHGEILDGSNRQDEMHPLEASILRFNPSSGDVTVYATGFRNPYDIAWDSTGQLWATDNTPDYHPPERLHRVVPGGLHGYPYYDCDVCFAAPEGVTVIPPLVTFAPRVSPTGVTAYQGSQFPGYHNSLFVTLWSAFYGAQKVMHVSAGGSAPTNFATGFAAPIDVVVGPDGSLFVADWATGIIFKISYTG